MRKKINVVHLIPNLGTGGAENVVLNLFQKIDKNKFNIFIIFWENRYELLQEYNISTDKIIKLNLKKPISVSSILKVAKSLKRLNADIVHTHFIDADLMGFICSIILRIPHLITIHSFPFPQKTSHCIRYKLSSYFVKYLICVSNTVKEYLMQVAKIDQRKLILVHNGINLEKFSKNSNPSFKHKLKRELKIKENCKIVGNVSRLIKQKGHQYLIYAIPNILKYHPETMFLIVGDGQFKEELNRITQRLNVQNNVIFTGTRSDIPELIDIMDIFVFPAVNEALGLCVLEAMSMGKAVIAAKDAAMLELITNDEDGILVTPRNSLQIEDAILNLLNNPELCQQIGGMASLKARNFSVKNMIGKIEYIYKNL